MFGFLFHRKSEGISSILQRANSFYSNKKFNKAIKLYKQILNIDSMHFAARANLATAYFETGKFSLSIPYFLSLLEDDFSNPWWHNYLSQAYQNIGKFELAIKEAWQAFELDDKDKSHQLNLAYTIYETSEEIGIDSVKSLLSKWYKKYPQSCIAKQCYKSFFYDKQFDCSEIEYIENLFDVFAPDFEDVLQNLDYQSPQDIAKILWHYFFSLKTVSSKRILDLGCGSGLCGKYLKEKFSDSIIFGVDISSNMLQEAAAKNIYFKLIKDDIIHCLTKIRTKFDIVVAADVLTYFGRLDSVVKYTTQVLNYGGVFCFSISKNIFNKKDFFLTPSSRFVHSLEYIKKLLEKNGLLGLQIEEKELRKEGEKSITGYIILAIKK